eukprot:4756885-Pyramimonas_sp.AAC.1
MSASAAFMPLAVIWRNRHMSLELARGRSFAGPPGENSIARDYLSEKQTRTIAAHVAEGTGAEVPALSGLTSLQRRRAILARERGKENIIFPNEAQCDVQAGMGAKILRWEKGTSGD